MALSRLVRTRSCCNEVLAWSAGHVHRVFDDVTGEPIRITDRWHRCGRNPDTVDAWDHFEEGVESPSAFAERLARELESALQAAPRATRAEWRGEWVATSSRPAPRALSAEAGPQVDLGDLAGAGVRDRVDEDDLVR